MRVEGCGVVVRGVCGIDDVGNREEERVSVVMIGEAAGSMNVEGDVEDDGRIDGKIGRSGSEEISVFVGMMVSSGSQKSFDCFDLKNRSLAAMVSSNRTSRVIWICLVDGL